MVLLGLLGAGNGSGNERETLRRTSDADACRRGVRTAGALDVGGLQATGTYLMEALAAR